MCGARGLLASILMRLTLKILALSFAPLVAAGAQGSPASQSWTMCTTGDMRSCGRFALSTDAVRSGLARTGTSVELRVTNLQGSLPADNTLWSLFESVTFAGHFSGITGTTASHPLTPVLVGQSPEPNSWAWQSGRVLDVRGEPMSLLQFYSPELRSTIAGCDEVDPAYGPDYPSIYTCTPAQFAILSLEMPAIFDADQFETVKFITEGFIPGAPDILLGECSADPGAAAQDPGESACTVLEHTVVHPPTGDPAVVPEPASVALFGTGLVGLLAWVVRRQRLRA